MATTKKSEGKLKSQDIKDSQSLTAPKNSKVLGEPLGVLDKETETKKDVAVEAKLEAAEEKSGIKKEITEEKKEKTEKTKRRSYFGITIS